MVFLAIVVVKGFSVDEGLPRTRVGVYGSGIGPGNSGSRPVTPTRNTKAQKDNSNQNHENNTTEQQFLKDFVIDYRVYLGNKMSL